MRLSMLWEDTMCFVSLLIFYSSVDNNLTELFLSKITQAQRICYLFSNYTPWEALEFSDTQKKTRRFQFSLSSFFKKTFLPVT